MKHLIVISIFIVTAVFYSGCSDNPFAPEASQTLQSMTSLDKKPAPTLNITTEYYFVALQGITDAQGRLLAWEGPVSGDINGVIKWWMDGATMVYTGQASHYADRFEIWNASETVLLLAGDEAGSTTARHGKNSNWRTNGIVTEAYGEFVDWIGRKNHCEGHFTWAAPGLPEHGTGTLRVN